MNKKYPENWYNHTDTLFTWMENNNESKPPQKHVCTENVIICISFIQLLQADVER
jgi:hypothetical protein